MGRESDPNVAVVLAVAAAVEAFEVNATYGGGRVWNILTPLSPPEAYEQATLG